MSLVTPPPIGVDPESARGYYDVLAKDFADQDAFWSNPYDTEVWRLEHDLLLPFLNRTLPLLDLGCGFYPHDGLPDSVHLVAGDISFDSLRVAAQMVPPNKTVRLVQFDVHSIPFAAKSFHQAIAGGELLNHVDYKRVLIEIGRVMDQAECWYANSALNGASTHFGRCSTLSRVVLSATLLVQLERNSEFAEYLQSVRARFKMKRNFIKLIDRAKWS